MKYTGAMFGRLYSQKNTTSQWLAPAAAAFLMVFSIAALTFGGLVLSADSANAKTGKKEWILHQVSDMGGATVVYVTDDAVRVTTEKLGCNLLCRAPDWKVHCYQPQDKLEWIGDLSLFSGIVMGNPYALPKAPRAIPWKVVGSGDFQGLKYSKYGSRLYGNSLLCTADDIPLAPKAAEFLSRLYTMPVITNVPVVGSANKFGTALRVDKGNLRKNDYDCASDLRKGEVQFLRTVSWKSLPYNPVDFAPPKNFKRVSDIIQVTFSADKKDQLGDMLDNVGFTTKLDKGSGKGK
jgi:hypothetical protein